jgi:hypothetical protein
MPLARGIAHGIPPICHKVKLAHALAWILGKLMDWHAD